MVIAPINVASTTNILRFLIWSEMIGTTIHPTMPAKIMAADMVLPSDMGMA